MANVIEFVVKGVDQLSDVLDTSVESWSRMKKAMAAAGITAGLYATINLASKSLDEAEAMKKLAVQANTSASTMSALSFAAEMSNTSAQGLAQGLTFLNRAMAEGQASEAGRALEYLGVSARTAEGALRPTEQVLLDLADAFKNGANDALKTNAAMTLLGRGGKEMVPLLNEGRDGIERLMMQAKQLGLVINDDFADAADNLNDRLLLVSKIGIGAMNQAMEKLAPNIDAMIKQFTDFTAAANGASNAGAVIAAGFQLMFTPIMSVAGAIKATGDLIGGIFAALKQALAHDFSGALTTIKKAGEDWSNSAETNIKAIIDLWKEHTAVVKNSSDEQKKSIADISEKEKERKDSLKEQEDATEGIRSALERMSSQAASLWEAVQTPAEKYEETLRQIWDLKEAGFIQDEQALEMIDRYSEKYQEQMDKEVERNAVSMGLAEEYTNAIIMKLTEMGEFTEQMTDALVSSSLFMIKGIGDAFGNTIMFGGSLLDALGNVAKNAIAMVISALVQWGVQRMLLSLLNLTAQKQEASAGMATAAAETYGNSFASAAAIPVYGWAIAPGVAATNLAMVLGGMAGAVAAGGVLGQTVGAAGIAHGGLDFVPAETTYLLDRGERVLSPRQNRDLTAFLDEGERGQTVVIENITIHVLENATNVEAFSNMDRVQLRNTIGQPIVDALNEMARIGIMPSFAR